MNDLTLPAVTEGLEKGKQWWKALHLLKEMSHRSFVTDVGGLNAASSACEKGKQWWQALRLLLEMLHGSFTPNPVSHNAAISACDCRGGKICK